jgi:hypothetical protein
MTRLLEMPYKEIAPALLGARGDRGTAGLALCYILNSSIIKGTSIKDTNPSRVIHTTVTDLIGSPSQSPVARIKNGIEAGSLALVIFLLGGEATEIFHGRVEQI